MYYISPLGTWKRLISQPNAELLCARSVVLPARAAGLGQLATGRADAVSRYIAGVTEIIVELELETTWSYQIVFGEVDDETS
jgi:hypothetical protein